MYSPFIQNYLIPFLAATEPSLSVVLWVSMILFVVFLGSSFFLISTKTAWGFGIAMILVIFASILIPMHQKIEKNAREWGVKSMMRPKYPAGTCVVFNENSNGLIDPTYLRVISYSKGYWEMTTEVTTSGVSKIETRDAQQVENYLKWRRRSGPSSRAKVISCLEIKK